MKQKSFIDYINSKTGSGRIFSREDIDDMSLEDFGNYREALYSQLAAIGVPYAKELHESPDVENIPIYRDGIEQQRPMYVSKMTNNQAQTLLMPPKGQNKTKVVFPDYDLEKIRPKTIGEIISEYLRTGQITIPDYDNESGRI